MKLEKVVNANTSFFFFFFFYKKKKKQINKKKNKTKKKKKKKKKKKRNERGLKDVLKKYAFVNSVAPHVELHYPQIEDKSIFYF
jgi:uncharacterized membrane protein